MFSYVIRNYRCRSRGFHAHAEQENFSNAAALETVRVSRNPTKAIKADGKVQTNEEAKVYVEDLDLVVTVEVLKDTRLVLSLGRLCEDHGYSHEWIGDHRPQTTKNGRKDSTQHGELRAHSCPRFFQRIFQYKCSTAVKYVLHHRSQSERSPRRDQ